MIKILITEDNDTIRDGLALLINATEGMECIDKYSNGEDMLAEIYEKDVDIYLQDIGLPGISGIECSKKIREKNHEAVIIILTVYEDEDTIFEALKAGASGYLLKKTPPAQLIEAIKDAYNGGSPMSPSIARKVVAFFNESKMINKDTGINLTERERNVLQSLSAGNSYKIIADELFISIDTVRFYIRKIYKKLHVHTQSEAVAKAIKKGLI